MIVHNGKDYCCKGSIKDPNVLVIISRSKHEIEFKCKRCHKVLVRPATKKEQREYMQHLRLQDRRMGKLHGLWWEYLKMAGDKKGYSLMTAIRNWADKHPEVVVTGCDDDYHTSSLICLIPHRTDNEFFGTTMVVVPQIVGEPLNMFLYPVHADGLLKALQSTKAYKATKPVQDEKDPINLWKY